MNELSGKQIVFIASGTDLNKFPLYEQISKNLGVVGYLLEDPSNALARRLHERGIVRHLPICLGSAPDLVEQCVKVIAAHVPEADAVVTFWDDAVALTARIAESLNLITTDPHCVDICHDKYATRKKLDDLKLANVTAALLMNEEEAQAHASRASFPCILKPVQGAASIGIYVCNNAAELLCNFAMGRKLLTDIYAEHELMGLCFADAKMNVTSDSSNLLSFVCEDYIGGPEVDIDMIMYKGQVAYASVSDDWPYEAPWFCELGVNYPSHLPSLDQQRLLESAQMNVKAFGLTFGVLHVEMKLDPVKGPVLIEINARMGGGPCQFFHKHVFGVDLAEQHIRVHCGLKPNHTTSTPSCWGLGMLLYPRVSGVVAEDMHDSETRKNLLKKPHVVEVYLCNIRGDAVVGWNDGYPSHIGLLMCSVPVSQMTYPQAVAYCQSLRSAAILTLEPPATSNLSDSSENAVHRTQALMDAMSEVGIP